ncbi:putative serine/threonine-protein kinase-like protein CCR3 isoform X2 [Triticum urartu]|uniref:putative serine/threonine-protein kinase-like protein CCR3 isoform X2 n=1 Tax=Triticum urartu TaxID=4572 RepID=UPI002042DA0C|nr:putative serine/threonine-protein kinase-like protein CCR3 isoform X2 [Triticum urartu]
MALWTGLGQAATVAQLVGADVGGLISMIVQAAMTARQNKSECEQLARRVLMIAQLLPHVQEPEAAQPLAGLGDTLRDTHELVVSCQGRSAAYQFVMASRTAEKFREVQSKIDSYLILFPVISHIGITRRLERIYNVLVQDGSTRDEPSPFPQSLQLQESTQLAQEVLPHGTQEFTLAEIVAATNNFAPNTVIGEGGSGKVYMGRLYDGREVAIKSLNNSQSQYLEEEFCTELDILSRLRHKHIISLLGSCVTVSKDKCLLSTPQKKKKRQLTWWKKEPEEPEESEELQRFTVYEYMENGTLFDHMHSDHGSSTMSPVRGSWKMRIAVLLGVSRAIEHLHCHANPPIIHRDIKSANILFDANWVPRVSDFGLSVVWDMASEESELKVHRVVGTFGYLAPEYHFYGLLKPASDVYSLGVVMLEVLTGKSAYSQLNDRAYGPLTDFALPIIEVGNIEELLDKRPVPEPTPWQLQAMKRVAQIACSCGKLDAKDRPAISDIVANLEMAHELMCRDEAGSVDEPCLWPFVEQVDLPSDSPHSRSSSSAGYHSELESEVLEERR